MKLRISITVSFLNIRIGKHFNIFELRSFHTLVCIMLNNWSKLRSFLQKLNYVDISMCQSNAFAKRIYFSDVVYF